MASLEGISLDLHSGSLPRTILSSIGGFSQPARRQIRSLQDLLATLQRLKLDCFDGLEPSRGRFLGEGVSYKVWRYMHHTQKKAKVYAIKQVRLPSVTADSESFERQVACVLRDVEVMSNLSSHENILKIFGYGWSFQDNDLIPYLVTDYAPEGTLRSFLKNEKVPSQMKLMFCRDVAQGLHALHNCGIAHGDLKLDNVLAVPYLKRREPAVFKNDQEFQRRTSPVIACVSDFAHSLHLFDEEEGAMGRQRYGGTLVYNAPEISQHSHDQSHALNFRKCDVWSLGLLCWELLNDGEAFYEVTRIQEAFLPLQHGHQSISTSTNGSVPSTGSSVKSEQKPGHTSGSTIMACLLAISSQYCDIACEDMSLKMKLELSLSEMSRLQELFRMCLNADTAERVADIPELPLWSKRRTALVPLSNPQQTLKSSWFTTGEHGRSSWTFDIFRQSHSLPYKAKLQILTDCKRIASEPGQSLASGRAALQASFAYVAGFGCKEDVHDALRWLATSSSKRLHLADIISPTIRSLAGSSRLDPTWISEPASLGYVACMRRALRKKFLENLTQHNLAGSTASYTQYLHADLQFDARLLSTIFKDPSTLNSQDLHGDTPLQRACKLGKLKEAEWLLEQGADPTIANAAGCRPIHWLCMFQEDAVYRMAEFLVQSDDTINTVCRVEQNVDTQLPFGLVGTPLAFATAFNSITAIRALLNLGADPLLETESSQWWQADDDVRSSALLLACRYHLAEPLSLFLDHVLSNTRATQTQAVEKILEYCFRALPSSSRIERMFYHVDKTAEAASNTASILVTQYRLFAHSGILQRTLEPAIRRHDIEVANALLDAINRSGYSHPYRMFELDEIICRCTEVACSYIYDQETATSILEFGLQAGADVNLSYGSLQGRRPMDIASLSKRVDIVDWLISKGAQSNPSKATFHSTTRHTVMDGLQSVQAPVTRPPDQATQQPRSSDKIETVESLSAADGTLLQHATQETGHQSGEAIHQSRSEQSDLLAKKAQYMEALNSALLQAADQGFAMEVHRLLNDGADIYSKSSHGLPSLHLAARAGHAEVVKVLIEASVDVEYRSNTDHSALHTALFYPAPLTDKRKIFACTELLIGAGAHFDQKGADGRTLFEIVATPPRPDNWTWVIKKLVEHGAHPNPPDVNGIPLIDRAIQEHDFDFAKGLILSGTSVGGLSGQVRDVLHVCAGLSLGTGIEHTGPSKGLCELAEVCIGAGASLYHRDSYGRTPLELAVEKNNATVCLTLLEHHKTRGNLHRAQLLNGPVDDMAAPTSTPSGWRGLKRKVSRHSISVLPASFRSVSGSQSQSDVAVVKRAWKQAVSRSHWACVCAFVRVGLYGSTELFDEDAASMLFEYAEENDVSDTLVLFMGTYLGPRYFNQNMKPDPYLSRFFIGTGLS